jgi:alkylation response protein AidB-like acyl-CoA dehydrogenase
MLVGLDCARELAYEAILRVSEGQPAALELSRAKSFVTESIKSIAYTAHQLHGAIGYTLEHDLHLYTNRARAAELRLGTPFEHRAALASLIGLRSPTGF